MGFFSKLWNTFTKPAAQLFDSTSDFVSDVIDLGTDVSSGVGNFIADVTEWIPIAGDVIGNAVDEFNFQVDNKADLINDWQATASDLVGLGQLFVSDVLDPNVTDFSDLMTQKGEYFRETYFNYTIEAFKTGFESLFDFG